MAKRNNIVKYRKPVTINIGVVVFAFFIVYVLFYVFTYVTKDRVAEYEVEQGTIAVNNIYKGLIYRDETVAYAQSTGSINYYTRNASKVSVNDVIYSVDTQGNISELISAASEDGSGLSSSSLSDISEKISSFTSTYDSNEFYNVYTFKNEMNSQLSQTLNTAALNDLMDQVTAAEASGTFYRIRPETTGLVLYYTDGFEGKSAADFQPEDLDPSQYSKRILNTTATVNAQDPVYKLVTNENWSIVIAISSDLAQQLNEGSVVQVRFCKDNRTAYATYVISKIDESYYLTMTFTNSMVRYADERYMNIELMLQEESGLKIPNSAITTKDFYAVPKDYFTLGADSSDPSLLVRSDNSEETVTLVTPTIYYETEETYYVDESDVPKGSVLIKNDSSETYLAGSDVEQLQGVYNINKGYAVFKQINIKYQNEEYAIIETGTSYGVALYDHIALDGSKVVEDQLITK